MSHACKFQIQGLTALWFSVTQVKCPKISARHFRSVAYNLFDAICKYGCYFKEGIKLFKGPALKYSNRM